MAARGPTSRTSSAVVKAVVAASFADNDDAPRFSAAGDDYVDNNDAASEDGNFTLPAALPATSAVEPVLSFQIVGADVVDEDDIELRIVQNDGTLLRQLYADPDLCRQQGRLAIAYNVTPTTAALALTDLGADACDKLCCCPDYICGRL